MPSELQAQTAASYVSMSTKVAAEEFGYDSTSREVYLAVIRFLASRTTAFHERSQHAETIVKRSIVRAVKISARKIGQRQGSGILTLDTANPLSVTYGGYDRVRLESKIANGKCSLNLVGSVYGVPDFNELWVDLEDVEARDITIEEEGSKEPVVAGFSERVRGDG